jgi:hypothetical protein
MAGDDRIGIREDGLENLEIFGAAAVSQYDARVAAHALPLRTHQRGSGELRPERGLVHDHDLRGIQTTQLLLPGEGVVVIAGEALVPGANLLTNVATEDPLAVARPVLGRDGSAMLDRPVRDTTIRVHDAVGDDRIRRAGLKTSRAAPAKLRVRSRVHG